MNAKLNSLETSPKLSLPHRRRASLCRLRILGPTLALGIFWGARASAFGQSTFTKIVDIPVVSDAADSVAATWVDFDSDGDLDLYVSNSRGPNLLYRNEGHGGFTRITSSSIVTSSPGSVNPSYTSAAWADYDNDGRIDLYMARLFEPGFLFHQEPNGTFTRSTFGSSPAGGAAWADYDQDGWLDLLVPYNSLRALWHNDGKGNLVAAGIAINASGAGVTWADIDNDGDMDVLVAAGGSFGGTSVPTRFYRNDGQGKFTPIASGQVPERAKFVTNMTWGDYDNDGFLDLFLSRGSPAELVPAYLFHNNGDGTFTQVEAEPFTTDTGFTLGSSWGDYDNDGWLDLFVAETIGEPNRLYHNNSDGTFARVTSGDVATDPGVAAGAAVWGDYDRDGFLDLFVANGNGSSVQPNDYLYHNDGNDNAWITIKCVGTRSNRSAIGVKVRVKATINGKTFWQLREINTGDGWTGNPLEAHFGLGDANQIETLRIEWPSGTVQEMQNVAVKQLLKVTEPARIFAAKLSSVPQFTLHGGRNLQYDLQASSDLQAWSSFDTVTITNLDGKVSFTDPAPSGSFRFYRAMLR